MDLRCLLDALLKARSNSRDLPVSRFSLGDLLPVSKKIKKNNFVNAWSIKFYKHQDEQLREGGEKLSSMFHIPIPIDILPVSPSCIPYK